jgi:23S rRNA pseudouridine2605 synthase
MPERLQKILARHGLGSRREIERWITEGRVTVNLKPARIGDQFHEGDRIAIDGKEVTARLSIEVAPQVLMFHKSQGQPTTQDERSKNPRISPTITGDAEPIEHAPDTAEAVMDRLPAIRGSRWVPINPMHAGDSGLLLLTNDGNLGYALTRRKRWIATAYMVRVLAPSAPDDEARVAPEIPPRVNYDSGRGNETVEFTSVEPAGGEGANLWYRVETTRADHRAAVRALFESRELKVSRMTQVKFGAIELPRDLPRGRHRMLTDLQAASLYELAQIPMPEPPKPKAARFDPRKKKKKVAPDRRRAPKRRQAAKGSR